MKSFIRQKLLAKLQEHQFDGYIIPSIDEYMSEYTPLHAKRLEYVTGFTGSNGIAIILADKSLFFTDGRYLEQSQKELDSDAFIIYDTKFMHEEDWVANIANTKRIAYDPKLFTKDFIAKFKAINPIAYKENFVDLIWEDRPAAAHSLIYNYDIEYAGESREDKLAKCRHFMTSNQGTSLLITDPASICWLLNIRASDVEFTPLLLANALITCDAVYLFAEHNRLSFSSNDIRCHDDLPSLLKHIASDADSCIIYDAKQCSDDMMHLLSQYRGKNMANPLILWKSCKNQIELKHAIEHHKADGQAVAKLLQMAKKGELNGKTEYEIGVELSRLRSKNKGYVSDSFPAICGFRENSAIIHYRADEKSSKQVIGDGVLLIDSGGQYLGATTDITRTIYLGKNPPSELKEIYTRVLKGHIAIATLRFPKGVSGCHIDAFARQYLWQVGLDYPHGTGHGVGSCLSVHEGPQSISPALNKAPLEEGMIVSNEPGYYRPGAFGIRIENLLYTKYSDEYPGFLEFVNLTLAPYEKDLINFKLLSKQEEDFIETFLI